MDENGCKDLAHRDDHACAVTERIERKIACPDRCSKRQAWTAAFRECLELASQTSAHPVCARQHVPPFGIPYLSMFSTAPSSRRMRQNVPVPPLLSTCSEALLSIDYPFDIAF
jgi:hypothetical protein